MLDRFDRRVVPDEVLELLRAFQRRVPCHLGGGAALSGAHLAHRLSQDIDLFCQEAQDVRLLLRAAPEVARECGAEIAIVRDAGTFVRGQVRTAGGLRLEIDMVHESSPDIETPPSVLEDVALESLADLRASKITCILSRFEPRDLVDLLFLDRAGYPPEQDLPLALRKDAGVDPGVLAWLLGQFPVRPLPQLLVPLAEGELAQFRDSLRERFRRMSMPDPE